MHYEFLIEDLSGKVLLETVLKKILRDTDSFRVHAYRGIGRLPPNLKDADDPSKRILLHNLPRILNGYGRTYANIPEEERALVVLVCDLDDKEQRGFEAEIFAVLEQCNPAPRFVLSIAIEEGEAWLLGDTNAIVYAYPNAKKPILNNYINDSICGTWELLADAIYPGGSVALKKTGFQGVGAEKASWALKIGSHMKINENKSPSFQCFCSQVGKPVDC